MARLLDPVHAMQLPRVKIATRRSLRE